VSRALGCTDRRIDEARARMPVSGTMLRAHPALRQQWLHPLVRADLVRRIVLLGGPSTGKTSLAAKLALQMEEPWCPEYGRDYWFAHQVDHRLSMEDLETIACGQATLESRLAYGATAFLPVDTCPLTTWAYAMRYFGHASEALERTLELYLAFPRDYWLCDVDLPFEDTPDRSGPGSREEHQAITVRELERRGMSFLTVSGSLEKRAAFILQFMRGIQ